jgi:hypothetical protein
MPVLAIVSAHSAGAAGWAGSNIVFLLLPFSSGFIGGAIFASSGRVMSTGIGDIGRSGGMSYGMDLIGSCIGAMVAGTVFIPVLGIPATCLVVSAVDAAVLVVLVFGLNDPIADRLKFKIKNSKP